MKAHLANPHGADLNKYLKAGAPKPEFKRARANEPTVDQIQSDNLTALAKTYWAPQTKKNHVDFNPEVKKVKKLNRYNSGRWIRIHFLRIRIAI